MSAIWQNAASFAARAHAGQLRKDGETPYIAHLFRVAMTVRNVFEICDPDILAAALLHDTIEDTTVDYDELFDAFGPNIASLVVALTKDKRLKEDRREQAYMNQLLNAPWQARLIKLADVYDNLSDSPNASSMEATSLQKARDALQLAGTGEPELCRAATHLGSLIRKHQSE